MFKFSRVWDKASPPPTLCFLSRQCHPGKHFSNPIWDVSPKFTWLAHSFTSYRTLEFVTLHHAAIVSPHCSSHIHPASFWFVLQTWVKVTFIKSHYASPLLKPAGTSITLGGCLQSLKLACKALRALLLARLPSLTLLSLPQWPFFPFLKHAHFFPPLWCSPAMPFSSTS